MLISILTFLLGLAGALLCSFGAWSIYPPAGYITLGVFMMICSYLYSRAHAFSQIIRSQQKPEGE